MMCLYLMNIPYDEFYSAETAKNEVKVDVFSSATKSKTRTGTLAGGSYHVNEDGSDITGVIYSVKLGEGVSLADLSSYKEVKDSDHIEITTTNRGETTTISYDGQKTFSKVQGSGEVKKMESSSEFFTETSYGDYQLNLDEELLKTCFDAGTDGISGVVVTTTDGSGYGMRHLENLWRGYELAWSSGFTKSVHNCPTSVGHFLRTVQYIPVCFVPCSYVSFLSLEPFLSFPCTLDNISILRSGGRIQHRTLYNS